MPPMNSAYWRWPKTRTMGTRTLGRVMEAYFPEKNRP